MYRIAVCEDEAPLRKGLCGQCQEVLTRLEVEHTITAFPSAKELEAALNSGAPFDLLCLDILMAGKTGMELALDVRKRNEQISILLSNDERLPVGRRYADLFQDKFYPLSFSVCPGEVLAIMGANGVGKTTLTRCLCGLLKERSGRIILDGEVLGTKARQRKCFLVMQDVNHQLFCDSVWLWQRPCSPKRGC